MPPEDPALVQDFFCLYPHPHWGKIIIFSREIAVETHNYEVLHDIFVSEPMELSE